MYDFDVAPGPGTTMTPVTPSTMTLEAEVETGNDPSVIQNDVHSTLSKLFGRKKSSYHPISKGPQQKKLCRSPGQPAAVKKTQEPITVLLLSPDINKVPRDKQLRKSGNMKSCIISEKDEPSDVVSKILNCFPIKSLALIFSPKLRVVISLT